MAMRDEAPPELISRARRDRRGFGELYDHYLPLVYAFCRGCSRTREEAEDLAALTFERALKAIGGYEERSVPFSRWLLRIAANAAVDRARRAGHEARHRDLSRSFEESELDRWEEAYWLGMHIASLPADQREVVRLRFYEDQRFQDVAARMGRSEGAVKQLLRRALRTLRYHIEQEMGEGSPSG